MSQKTDDDAFYQLLMEESIKQEKPLDLRGVWQMGRQLFGDFALKDAEPYRDRLAKDFSYQMSLVRFSRGQRELNKL